MHAYDCEGNFLFKVKCAFVREKIFAMDWFWAAAHFRATSTKRLAIAFAGSGRIQLAENEKYAAPEIVETNLSLACVKFSPDGMYIACSGTKKTGGKEIPLVDFYAPSGQLLRTLKVPGVVGALSWNDLRVAMAVDSFIYFANVRPGNGPHFISSAQESGQNLGQ